MPPACRINNWSLFGLEFGRQCFCGNMLESTDKVYDVQCGGPCGGPCGGQKNQTCGGKLRLNVYRITDVCLYCRVRGGFANQY